MARDMAAYYCGLSVNTFADRVKAGRYPEGIRDGGRILWDKVALDNSLDAESGTMPSLDQVDKDRAELDKLYGHDQA